MKGRHRRGPRRVRNTSAKGALAEREVRAILEEQKYDTIRSRGSLGPWDVTAFPKRSSERTATRFVQVKNLASERFPTGEKLQEYFDAASERVGLCEVWLRTGGRPIPPSKGGGRTRVVYRVRDLSDWERSEYTVAL